MGGSSVVVAVSVDGGQSGFAVARPAVRPCFFFQPNPRRAHSEEKDDDAAIIGGSSVVLALSVVWQSSDAAPPAPDDVPPAPAAPEHVASYMLDFSMLSAAAWSYAP